MKQITEYTRKCPCCNIDLYYGNKKILKVAINKNTKCYSCSNKGENNPRFGVITEDKTKEKLRIAMTGKKRSKETIEKHKENYLNNNYLSKINKLKGNNHHNFGITRSEEFKSNLRKLKTGKPRSQSEKESISKAQIGRKHSNETKRKQRLSKIKYIEKTNGSVAPRYNKDACIFFEKLEKQNNWNGFYALKNKEFLIKDLGYFLDYYEPNLNIVIEYDEESHYNIDNSLKNRDIQRMNEIKEYLNCRFYRYNEKSQQLKEY